MLSSSQAFAQAKSDVIVVRMLEREKSIRLAISRGDAPVELIEIENGGSDKNFSAGAKGLQQVLAKLYAEGYVVQSSLAGAPLIGFSTQGAQINTLILAKTPKP